jgi:hypothetical protein
MKPELQTGSDEARQLQDGLVDEASLLYRVGLLNAHPGVKIGSAWFRHFRGGQTGRPLGWRTDVWWAGRGKGVVVGGFQCQNCGRRYVEKPATGCVCARRGPVEPIKVFVEKRFKDDILALHKITGQGGEAPLAWRMITKDDRPVVPEAPQTPDTAVVRKYHGKCLRLYKAGILHLEPGEDGVVRLPDGFELGAPVQGTDEQRRQWAMANDMLQFLQRNIPVPESLSEALGVPEGFRNRETLLKLAREAVESPGDDAATKLIAAIDGLPKLQAEWKDRKALPADFVLPSDGELPVIPEWWFEHGVDPDAVKVTTRKNGKGEEKPDARRETNVEKAQKALKAKGERVIHMTSLMDGEPVIIPVTWDLAETSLPELREAGITVVL